MRVTERGTIEHTSDTAPAWHTLSFDAVLVRLATHPTGLTAAAAAERLAVHGPNELQTVRTQSA
jgi:Cation transporter/ATPase, N-terminus